MFGHFTTLCMKGLTFPLCIFCIEIKINVNFLFSHFFVVPQKGFMKVFKAFIKPFEAPQRIAKIKLYVVFLRMFGIRTERVKVSLFHSFPFNTFIALLTHLLQISTKYWCEKGRWYKIEGHFFTTLWKSKFQAIAIIFYNNKC